MENEVYKLIYKIDKKIPYIRLLGKQFVNRNKNLGFFIYKDKKYPLLETIETKKIQEEDEMKMNLFFFQKIYNKSCMFKDCEALLKVFQPNIKENASISYIHLNLENDENLFNDIEEYSINENVIFQNLKNMKYSSAPSSIQTKQQKDSKGLAIPDIYENLNIKNNQKNSIILSRMFESCLSLISIPDISK